MHLPPRRADARYRDLRSIFAAGLPFLVLLAYMFFTGGSDDDGAPQPGRPSAPLRTAPPKGITVVLIIDSMGETNGSDSELMPRLAALESTSLYGPLHSCAANFTLPCLLTSFEGRQSPFLTALSNFSGEATGRPNWLDSMRRAGFRLAFVGDHTLPDIYPDAFVTEKNYENLRIPSDENDQFGFDHTLEWIDAREHDAIITHIVGTDKVSHRERPGTPEYVKIFRRADTFIGEVAARLDPKRDTLLVFGDHGHGPEGHHTREAWYLFRGPGVTPARLPLDQTTIPFLLSRIHDLSLPQNYEGELPWAAFSASTETSKASEAAWRSKQAGRWNLRQLRASRADLNAEHARHAASRDDAPAKNLLAAIPWLLHLILIGAAIAGYFSGQTPIHPSYILWQGAWLGLAMFYPTFAPWAALIIQGWLSWPRARGFGGVPSLLVWSALALLSGLAIPWMFETFHVKVGGSWIIGVWFGATAAVPLVVGAIVMQRLDARSRWSRAALVMMATAMMLPGPGVYYYGFAQSICHLLFGAGLLAIVLETRPYRGLKPALVLAFLTGGVFSLVRAGGWDWRFGVHLWIENWPGIALAALYTASITASAVIWRQRGVRWAATTAILLLVNGWLLVDFLHFEAWRIAGLGVLTLSLSAALRLLEPTERKSVRTAWQVTLILGIAFVGLWSVTDGFYLRNLKLSTVLKMVGTDFETEADLAAAAGRVMMLQYTMAGIYPLVATGLTLGSSRMVHLGRWVILLASFKVFAQVLQFRGVAFVEEARTSELIIQEATGMAWLTVILWIGLLIVAFYRHAAQWVLGRDRVP